MVFQNPLPLIWKKTKKPLVEQVAEVVKQTIKVLEQVEAPVPEVPKFFINRIAAQMLEMDYISTLRQITEADTMLEKIEQALAELDDEDVLLMLH